MHRFKSNYVYDVVLARRFQSPLLLKGVFFGAGPLHFLSFAWLDPRCYSYYSRLLS